LIHSLERMHHFAIEVAVDLTARNEGGARVLLAASDVPLAGDQAAQLNEFVRRGGGVVLLHSTLAAWSEHDAVAEMAGWRLGGPAPLTELVIRVADHPVTERLSPEIRVEDELYVSEGPPAEANVLLRASSRHASLASLRTRAPKSCCAIPTSGSWSSARLRASTPTRWWARFRRASTSCAKSRSRSLSTMSIA